MKRYFAVSLVVICFMMCCFAMGGLSETGTTNPEELTGHTAPAADAVWNAHQVCLDADCDEVLYDFASLLNEGGIVELDRHVMTGGPIEIDNTVILDLNGYNITAGPEDTAGDGVFHVVAGGDLTINGEGTINGVGNNAYNMAVWADGGKVTINGGTYTNVGASSETDGEHFDLIYAKNGGEVYINGGRFKCETPDWTLNSHDTQKGTFVVKGGTFVGYNPEENNTENPVVSWLAEGYEAVEADGGYTVRKYDLAELMKNGGEVTLERNVVTGGPIEIDNTVILDLNGYNITAGPEDTAGDGVFHVVAGGDLTINGEGTINGVGNNAYNMAVWADGGKVTINGGAYTNKGAFSETDGEHFDLIYAKNGGEVYINGGRFECETPDWTLNSHDTQKGTFVVKGGTFVGYNPEENITENPVISWVAEGYEAVEDNGIFTVILHIHQYETAVTAPTCEEAGYTTYTCVACGDTYKDDEVAALGHTVEKIDAVAATCTATGLTEGERCSVCEKVLKEQEEVPALGHIYETAVTAPTCEEAGYTTYTCAACGDTYKDDEVAALGHTVEKIEAVAATCTATGLTEGERCSVCKKVLKEQEEIPALGHTVSFDKAVYETEMGGESIVISAEVSCGHEVEITYMLPEKLENIGVNGNSITVSGKEAGVATIAVRTSDGFMSDDVCNVIIHSDAQLVLPKALTTIKEQAFADMPVEEVVLGDGVAVIGERAFENCKDLVLINLADNVQIGEYAFDGCDNLTIICTEGSTGHAYAVANEIPYIIR